MRCLSTNKHSIDNGGGDCMETALVFIILCSNLYKAITCMIQLFILFLNQDFSIKSSIDEQKLFILYTKSKNLVYRMNGWSMSL